MLVAPILDDPLIFISVATYCAHVFWQQSRTLSFYEIKVHHNKKEATVPLPDDALTYNAWNGLDQTWHACDSRGVESFIAYKTPSEHKVVATIHCIQDSKGCLATMRLVKNDCSHGRCKSCSTILWDIDIA